MDLKIIGTYLIAWLFVAFFEMDAQAGDLLRFVENRGQWHENVQYRADGRGVSVFVLERSIKYLFYEDQHLHEHMHAGGRLQGRSARLKDEELKFCQHAVEVTFLGASDAPVIVPSDAGNERYNYFYGNNQKTWVSDVKGYGRLSFKNIYQGIDLLLYSDRGDLKYDWILRENADAASIVLEYAGQDELAVADDQLIIRTSLGTIVEGVPVTYQMTNGRRSTVTCEYKLTNNRVRFSVVDDYDHTVPLVIDPKLIFSTYSGSVSDNWGYTATFDDEGNLYSGGIVAGQQFPVTNGALQENWGGFWDVAILKYDSLGENLHYATFLGGNSSEVPASIIVNNAGELLVYGTTSSTNFPVTDNAFQKVFAGGSPLDNIATTLPQLVGGVPYHNGSDLYVAKISSNGDALLSSSYIGGAANDGVILTRQVLTKNYGDHFRGEIFSDEENNVYVASTSSSADFPVVNAFQPDYGGGANDGVVFKFSADLSTLIWSSFLGDLPWMQYIVSGLIRIITYMLAAAPTVRIIPQPPVW